MKDSQYDFFICHASEDKLDFVRPLAEKLSGLGYKVWYDEFELNLGNSLTLGISEGIKSSLYGIVVLSKYFFEKKWAQKEFLALFNREIIQDRNLILPIWLEIDREDVYNFSPLIVDRVAIKVAAKDIDTTIDALLKATKINITTASDVQKIIDHLKTCGADRRQKYYLDAISRIDNIFHYQQEYYNWYITEFQSKEWDQSEVDLKGKEFERDYNLPQGVWLNPEPFDWVEIQQAKSLISKWIFHELTYLETEELRFVLDEILDTDVYYILYGFPHSTIRSPEVHEKAMDGISIGLSPQEAGKKPPSEKRVLNYLFKKYY